MSLKVAEVSQDLYKYISDLSDTRLKTDLEKLVNKFLLRETTTFSRNPYSLLLLGLDNRRIIKELLGCEAQAFLNGDDLNCIVHIERDSKENYIDFYFENVDLKKFDDKDLLKDIKKLFAKYHYNEGCSDINFDTYFTNKKIPVLTIKNPGNNILNNTAGELKYFFRQGLSKIVIKVKYLNLEDNKYANKINKLTIIPKSSEILDQCNLFLHEEKQKTEEIRIENDKVVVEIIPEKNLT